MPREIVSGARHTTIIEENDPCLFSVGIVTCHEDVRDLCERVNVHPCDLLFRHMTGDWGELTDPYTAQANQMAIGLGWAITSHYRVTDEDAVRIKTSAGHQETEMLAGKYEAVEVVIHITNEKESS
jgi:hypothetical protein